MSLIIEYYNYFDFTFLLNILMSEDIPERTPISDAERKRLRREKETPEEYYSSGEQRGRQRSLRLILIQSEVSFASISGYYRLPLERTRLRWKQLTAWITSEYSRLPSERTRLRWKQLIAWITSEYTRLPSRRTRPKVNKRFV